MTTTTQTTTTYGYQAPSTKHLPIGVAILAVLIGIVGFIVLIAAILILVGATVGYLSGFAIAGAGLVGGLVVLVIAVVILAVAFGLWDQELWALVLAIIVVGFLWIEDIIAGRLVSLGGIILLLLLIYLVAVSGNFYS